MEHVVLQAYIGEVKGYSVQLDANTLDRHQNVLKVFRDLNGYSSRVYTLPLPVEEYAYIGKKQLHFYELVILMSAHDDHISKSLEQILQNIFNKLKSTSKDAVMRDLYETITEDVIGVEILWDQSRDVIILDVTPEFLDCHLLMERLKL